MKLFKIGGGGGGGGGKASEAIFNTWRGVIAKCTYTHVCTHLHACTCCSIFILPCMHAHKHVCMHVYAYARILIFTFLKQAFNESL